MAERPEGRTTIRDTQSMRAEQRAERSESSRGPDKTDRVSATPKPTPVAPAPAPAAPAAPAKLTPAQQALKIGAQGLAGVGGFLGFGPIGAGAASSAAGKVVEHIIANPKAGAAHGTSGPARPDERMVVGQPAAPAAPAAPAPMPTLPSLNVDWAGMYGGNMAQPTGQPAPMLTPTPAQPMQPANMPSMDPGLTEVKNALTKAGTVPNTLQPAIMQAQAAAEGKVPSAAEIMANQRAEQIAKQQMAMSYARGGFNPGALRGAQLAGASAQQDAIASAAALRAQEQAAARNQYANLLAQQGQFEMGAAQNQAQAAQAYASLLGQQQGLYQQGQYQTGTLGLGQQQLAADVAARNAALGFQKQQATVDAILRARGLDIQQLAATSGAMTEQERLQIARDQIKAQEDAARLQAGVGIFTSMVR